MAGSPLWTSEQTCALVRMWAEGRSGRQIAEVLHVTRNAVLGKVDRLDLPPRKPRQPQPRIPKPRAPSVARFRPKKRFVYVPYFIPPTPAMQPRQLVDLSSSECRWPIGEVGKPGFFFCGAHAVEHCPYCAFHASKAYRGWPHVHAG